MTVLTEQHGRVLLVTIDRPDVRNAVDAATAQLLTDAFLAFDQNDQLDVAVLTGASGTFCAGADLKAVATGDGVGPGLEPVERIVGSPGPLGPTRLQPTKPVIAAVEGHAVAGGLELSLWCDLRVAARDAVFGVYCRRWGIPLCDGGTVRLPRLVGQSVASDMILTGRGVVGDELRRLGYTVDGLDTITSARAGLTATRDDLAVAAVIELDDDTGAVVVALNV